MGRYNSCLVLSALPGESTQLHKEMYEQLYGNCEVVMLTFDQDGELNPLSPEDQQKIYKLHGDAFICVHAHGGKGIGLLENNKHQQITYQQLAELITDNLNSEQLKVVHIYMACCFTIARTKTRHRSFVDLLLQKLRYFDTIKFEIVATTDMYTIMRHRTSGKIFTHFETDVESKIRAQYKERRLEILSEVKSDFITEYEASSKLPTPIVSAFRLFAKQHLQADMLMHDKKLNEFMSSLCQFLLNMVYLNPTYSSYLIPMVVTLMVAKNKLVDESIKRQTIEYDKTIGLIKQANYARPSKMLFTLNNGKKEMFDCYWKKTLK